MLSLSLINVSFIDVSGLGGLGGLGGLSDGHSSLSPSAYPEVESDSCCSS